MSSQVYGDNLFMYQPIFNNTEKNWDIKCGDDNCTKLLNNSIAVTDLTKVDPPKVRSKAPWFGIRNNVSELDLEDYEQEKGQFEQTVNIIKDPTVTSAMFNYLVETQFHPFQSLPAATKIESQIQFPTTNNSMCLVSQKDLIVTDNICPCSIIKLFDTYPDNRKTTFTYRYTFTDPNDVNQGLSGIIDDHSAFVN